MENVKQTVRLSAKDAKEGNEQFFGVQQANRLLKMAKTQFELHKDESEWTWNGIELAKAEPKGKAEKETKKE